MRGQKMKEEMSWRGVGDRGTDSKCGIAHGQEGVLVSTLNTGARAGQAACMRLLVFMGGGTYWPQRKAHRRTDARNALASSSSAASAAGIRQRKYCSA